MSVNSFSVLHCSLAQYSWKLSPLSSLSSFKSIKKMRRTSKPTDSATFIFACWSSFQSWCCFYCLSSSKPCSNSTSKSANSTRMIPNCYLEIIPISWCTSKTKKIPGKVCTPKESANISQKSEMMLDILCYSMRSMLGSYFLVHAESIVIYHCDWKSEHDGVFELCPFHDWFMICIHWLKL